jgi:hypothetical protein
VRDMRTMNTGQQMQKQQFNETTRFRVVMRAG